MNLESLRELNFGQLIQLKDRDPATYTFDDCRKNCFTHPDVQGYCVECDRNGWHQSEKKPGLRLRNISHGAHASDFLSAMSSQPSIEGWHNDGVMFIFETPSNGGAFSKEPIEYAGHLKHPVEGWYWIHQGFEGSAESRSFPSGFRQKKYGDFVLSAILTFKLANAYATNLVKCGLNNQSREGYGKIGDFNPKCVKECASRFLKREIELVRPKVIFAMSKKVEDYLKQFDAVKGRLDTPKVKIQRLHHPAYWRMSNLSREEKWFRGIQNALREATVIDGEEYASLDKLFEDKRTKPQS